MLTFRNLSSYPSKVPTTEDHVCADHPDVYGLPATRKPPSKELQIPTFPLKYGDTFPLTPLSLEGAGSVTRQIFLCTSPVVNDIVLL